MLYKRSSLLNLLLLLCTLYPCRLSSQTYQRFSYTEEKMGSPFTIIFYSIDSQQAVKASRQVFSLVDSLNMIFSDYDPHSELSRLSANAGSGDWVNLSPALYDILRLSQKAFIESNSVFDITMGPMTDLWREARKTGKLPDAEKLEKVRGITGFHLIDLDTSLHRAKLKKQGMRLDLGGIAKGYIAQKVIEEFGLLGISSAMASAGGDIACSNPPPGKEGWIIGTEYPESYGDKYHKRLLIKNSAVATSGDMFQNTVINGKTYSHIIDPATGLGSTIRRTVTIIAPNGAEADWLATACSLLKINSVKKLIRKRPQTSFLILQKKARKVKVYMNRDFKRHII